MSEPKRLGLRARWRWLRSGNLPALIDALRRSTEMLDCATMQTDHAEYERQHIIAVGRRLVRDHDPRHETDRVVA